MQEGQRREGIERSGRDKEEEKIRRREGQGLLPSRGCEPRRDDGRIDGGLDENRLFGGAEKIDTAGR
jgi:hypothetical protein